jgi:hypothetical protein
MCSLFSLHERYSLEKITTAEIELSVAVDTDERAKTASAPFEIAVRQEFFETGRSTTVLDVPQVSKLPKNFAIGCICGPSVQLLVMLDLEYFTKYLSE